MATIALTRQISPALAECQLTYMDRDAIDVARAERQHAAYEDALRAMGAEVVTAPFDPTCPDCVFVEDTALVLDEIAVIGAMRRASRAPETKLLSHLLGTQRELASIQAPGTLEGGDVFLVGRTIFVGRSTRTNDHGIEQLRAIAEPHGYEVIAVDVPGCLHLTTGASRLTEEIVLLHPEWVDADAFIGVETLAIDPAEPWGANTLRLNDQTLMGDCFPRTRDIIESRGVTTRTVDISELMKAEAGLTCMSLLFDGDANALRQAIAGIQITADRTSHRRASASA